MAKVVYTAQPQTALSRLLSPLAIIRDLYAHRELIVAYTKREYQATHRSTFLGAAWAMLTPLILLALFTFVFGFIFQGRFTPNPNETATDFALALFVGLSLYLCVGNTLTQSPTLMFANAPYVKTLAFPIEILPVAQVAVFVINLVIGLGLCLVGFLLLKGFIHWTAIFVPLHVAIVALLCLGLGWFLSALGVFVRDLPSVTSPLSMVLMFISGVFFSIEMMAPHLRIIFKVNPLAVLISQGRGALLFGEIPNFTHLAILFAGALACAVFGYYFFKRTKAAFADVM